MNDPENMTNPNLFCANVDCPAKGQTGEGNIGLHSKKEQRYRCDVCNQTFSATKGTLFYRLRTDPVLVVIVITLMAYGCPIGAIIKAYGLDKRTVSRWWERSGQQCQSVHEHLMEKTSLDIQHAQTDELKVKMWGRSVWMGFSMMVSTRLWLGGVVSEKRDKKMVKGMIEQIKRVALCRQLLITVDGLPHYIGCIKKVFRSPLPSKRGRPRLIEWPTVMIGRVIKRRSDGELEIERTLHNGDDAQANALIKQTQGKAGVLNTAYIERLNGTFRQRLSWLKRRSRHLAHQLGTLSSGMYIVGSIYNLCETHHALRCKLHLTSSDRYRWIQRTPALAAGLTDHIWTVQELLSFRVPPPRWTPPKKRGRRSKEEKKLIERWA